MNISGSIQVHAVLLCLAFSELFNLAFSELLNLVFELEAEVSVAAQEEEDGDSPEEMCTIPYCSCPYHKNKGPPSPLSLPPPPHATEAYYEEGATQFARWPHY